MRLIFFSAIIIVSSLVNLYGQTSDKDLVLKKIEVLFDGMRSGDSSAVSSVFLVDATMQSISKDRQGNTIINRGSLSGFKNAVGTTHDQVWDERVANIQVSIDGDMAVAWIPYSFYLGDNFSHCGVNSMQFIKTEKGWKALSIVDTRRRTGCAEDL